MPRALVAQAEALQARAALAAQGEQPPAQEGSPSALPEEGGVEDPAPPDAEVEAQQDKASPLAGLNRGQPEDGSPAEEGDGNGTAAILNPLLGIFEEEDAVDADLADLVARVEDVSAIDLLNELREVSQNLGIS